MSYRLDCPDCSGPLQIRSSRAVTSTLRTIHLVCRDPDCQGHYGGDVTLTRVIRRSLAPSAGNHLRLAPPRPHPDTPLPIAANDGAAIVAPIAANDDAAGRSFAKLAS